MRKQLRALGTAVLTAGLALMPVSGTAEAAPIPRTVVMDGVQLAKIRSGLRTGTATPAQRDALKGLLSKADGFLGDAPWAVTHKQQTPPSGDKHDYLSQAPYWWASKPRTPDNPQGCPYVQRDGERNPEADAISDHTERGRAFEAIPALALAWYYTGDRKYAEHAETAVRAWFLDPATRMNPNMTYAQLIPCRTDVRGTGIIDSTQSFTSVVDAFAVLDAGAPGWLGKDRAGIMKWLTRYLDWMRTSPQAKKELAATNNHGTFLDMQNAAIALYIGERDLARSIVDTAKTERIGKQIAADGSQPLELSRTKTWHYSNFNLTALGRLAEIGRHVGVDLWSYQAPGGGSLRKAVDYLIPGAVHGKSAWPHEEIGPFDQWIAVDILHAAAEQGHDAQAAAALKQVPAPPGGDLWPIRPACVSLNLPAK
ncbi:alginate lyase family protein [Amycolatopsis sp. NPDC059021]|uniref:alginate lyase family protein n=1 Tax=Amycolatopsis sp. NPDC059021 TaxID=3346704 RepID=UPI00366FBF6F